MALKSQTTSTPTSALPEDGYDWLKYGQKFCHNEGSTRLYFRCKENKECNCPAKKTIDCVNRNDDLPKVKVMYSENHNHEPPHPLPRHPVTEATISALGIDLGPSRGPESSTTPSSLASPLPSVTATPPFTPGNSSFTSGSTMSKDEENDFRPESGQTQVKGFPSRMDAHVSELKKAFTPKKVPSKDGYEWLKYGQKNLYGNVFTRTYYRCRMNKSSNCPAKKTIDTINNRTFQGERSFNHGEHNHPPKLDPGPSPKTWKDPKGDSGRGTSATEIEGGIWDPRQTSGAATDPLWRQGSGMEQTLPPRKWELQENLSRFLHL